MVTKRISTLLFICVMSFVGSTIAQDTTKQRFSGVKVSVVLQRWLTAEELPDPEDEQTRKAAERNVDSPFGAYRDVFQVGPVDDLMIHVRLTNRTKKNIYYLSNLQGSTPYGYILFRRADETNWRALTPDRGRMGDKGGGDKWMLLAPGDSAEAEFSDLSTREGKHAVSVLVNNRPNYKKFAEVISDAFLPLKKPEPGK